MVGENLEKWIEYKFGVRDERLFDLDPEEARTEILEAELAREYERIRTQVETVDEEFQKAVRAGSEAEGHEQDRYKMKAKKIKRDYESRSAERDKHGRRLAATLVVQSFLEIGNEEPGAIQERILSKLDRSTLEKQDTNDYLASVVDALEVDEALFPDWAVDSDGYSEPVPVHSDDPSDPVTLEELTGEEPTDPELDWELADR